MEIFEITGLQTGIARDGVNFLEPADSFTDIQNGYIHRQVLRSRKGISLFAPRLDGTDGFRRVTGIFEHILSNGNKELLVTDQKQLYKYNTTSGDFDLVPLGGSLVTQGYSGFGLSQPEDYISGTSYPDKENNARFVFTCSAMSQSGSIGNIDSGVLFYDGTEVKCFTDTSDNPDYVPPDSGSGDIGTITRAKHVIYFGERLNLINPTTSLSTFNQGVLFSGIRNLSGNGDKFNVAGAGLIQLDTYDDIKGAQVFGDLIALNLTRSNWVLQKTTDAFNPYLPRKIPSVIGSDSSFGFAQWDDTIMSIGRTGILSMNERQSLRTDNKIPYFTRDDMKGNEFEVVYGGFDRDTSQFLFSYISSGTDDTTQDRVLAYNYEFKSWSIYDIRVSVFGQTDVGRELAWNQIDETIKPSWGRWDTTEEIWNKIGVTAATQKTLCGDNDGFIYQWNVDNDDYSTNITDISKATQAVVSVDDRPFKVGDFVVIENVEGMTQINNYDSSTDTDKFIPYKVEAVSTGQITLDVNSSNFDNYTSNTGTISKVISFSAKTNEFNPYRDQGRKCFISMVEFLINSDSKLFVSVYADGESSPFKENILMKPYNTQKERNWVELSIDHEADFFTFEMTLVSPAIELELTSIRLHVMPGGLTNG